MAAETLNDSRKSPAHVEGDAIDLTRVIDSSPISRLQWRVIALCFLVAFVDGFDTQAIGYVAPAIMSEFGIAKAMMGFGFSAGLVGLMIGAAGLSALADRIGRKPVIMLSCLTMGVFSLQTAGAQSFEMFMVGRFLTGIGLGGAIPAVNTMTAEFVPAKRRATLMTMMFAGVPCGAIAAGLVASFAGEVPDWRYLFIVGGILPIIVAVAIITMLPESIQFLSTIHGRRTELVRILAMIDPQRRVQATDRFTLPQVTVRHGSVRALFDNGRARPTLLLWLVFLCNLFLVYTLVSWLPTIMAASGVSLRHAVFSTMIFNIGGVAIGLLLARMSDRLGVERVTPWAFLGAAFSIAAVGSSMASSVTALAIIALVGGFVGGTQFSIHLLAVNQYPTEIRAFGLGAALSVGRIGGIAGPLFGGWMLSTGWTYDVLFVFAAMPALIGLAAVMALRQTNRQAI